MEKKQTKKGLEEKNNNFKEAVKEVKEELTEKAKNIKEELNEKTKDLKKDIKEKSDEIKEKTEQILKDIKDNSKKFDKKDIEENKAMACLAYIIAPVPYFVETKSKWVHYHAVQGMNLFIITVILSLCVSIICSLILWPFYFLKALLKTALYAFVIIYAIIGIVNVCNGEAKELPIINRFKFIKK